MKYSAIVLVLMLALAMGCQPQKSSNENQNATNLGVLQYQFTISAEARPHFDKGLLLLHSFEYEDARTAFQAAIEADDTELMAYWGEAMSHYRALWGLQDVPAGRAVMEKVGPTEEERLAKADNELEGDFWKGLEKLYGEGELTERNQAYADHMATLYEKYPGNQEVAAFYALGLMWSVPLGRDEAVFERSARVAAGVLEENPNHPGALHYMIHAYDDPEFAELAVNAADKYANVAPDATHALHMPSHIYLALGRWNDVVSSNETSYAASVSRMERLGLDDKARGYHSYAWLHYGYLQQGRFDKAKGLLKDMQTYTLSAQTRGAKRYLIGMQSRQLVETGGWGLEEAPIDVDYDGLSLGAKGINLFFKSMLAYQANDAVAIENHIRTLDEYVAAAELLVTDEGIAMCSAGPTRTAPNKNSILAANIRLEQMKALIAMLNQDDASVERHLKMATSQESEAEYSFGPPYITYPTFEQYGDWLLKKERYEEALVQFDQGLNRAPNRAKALQGKMAALTAMGREKEAAQVQTILDEFWRTTLVAGN